MKTNKNIIQLRKQAKKENFAAVLCLISLLVLPYLLFVTGSPALAFLLMIAFFVAIIVFASSATEKQVQADQAQRILNY
jgi:cbb3-type cytochrome oxidase subunit 3